MHGNRSDSAVIKSMSQPSITIIIPTFNRARSLKKVLQSLDSLEKPDSIPIEVVIVNNGSNDETGSLLVREMERSRPMFFKVLVEKRRGKASALNRGIASAQGNLIFVVDDDVVMDPKCLVRHLECYRTTAFDAVQGRVLPGVDSEGRQADPQRLQEYNIPIVDHGEDICDIRGLTGNNMSFRREVFEKVGLFNASLGPGASGFSEDTEFSMRIREAGFKIGYMPSAVVYHELDTSRYGRAYNRLAQYHKGQSSSLYRHRSIFLNIVPNLFANSFRYLVYRILGDCQKSYKTEGRVMRYWGYLMASIKKKADSDPGR